MKINKIINILSKLFISSFLAIFIKYKGVSLDNLQLVFIFLYFLIIAFIIDKVLECIKVNKINVILTLVTAIILSVISLNVLSIKQLDNNKLIVNATGEKCNISQGAEVWITEICIDDKEIALKNVDLSNGWYFKDNALVTYPNEDSNNLLILVLPKARKIEIQFLKHPWSGKVIVSNAEKVIFEEDLYDGIVSKTKLIISGSYKSNGWLILYNIISVYFVWYNFLIMCTKMLIKFNTLHKV